MFDAQSLAEMPSIEEQANSPSEFDTWQFDLEEFHSDGGVWEVEE